MLFHAPHLSTFFYLLAGHALADYALQDERMVYSKHWDSIRMASEGPWWWWLTAHSLINGMVVGLLTAPWLGMAETSVHWLADYAKMKQWLTPNQDQAIHLLSKLLWAKLT